METSEWLCCGLTLPIVGRDKWSRTVHLGIDARSSVYTLHPEHTEPRLIFHEQMRAGSLRGQMWYQTRSVFDHSKIDMDSPIREQNNVEKNAFN